MTLTFTPQRFAELRQRSDLVHACLVLPSETVKQDSLRHLYRQFPTHDEDGKVTGTKREPVTVDGRRDRLTVLLVETVDVFAGEPEVRFRRLDAAVARACGFKTVEGLKADWTSRHPRSPLAQLVWFALGDTRDRDRYLQRWVSRGGDYTGSSSSAIDPLPALTEAQLKELAAYAHQRDLKRQVQEARKSAGRLSLAQRVARIEAASGRLQREVKHEVAIIAERTQRGLRKL